MTVHAPILVPNRRAVRVGAWHEPAVLALLAVVAWLTASRAFWDVPLNNDVSWQLWVARQLRHGVRFGRDIAEINPPLWFWEAVPVSALANRLGMGAGHLLVAAVMARTVVAVVVTTMLAGATPQRRLLLAIGLLAILLALPLFSFGEREHLLLFGVLPYAALIARRAEGTAPAGWRTIAVGLFAAWSLALKPHFVLFPVALEVWLAWRIGRAWRPIRAESVVLAATALLYCLATLLFAREWLADVLPLARAAYGDFAPPFATLLTRRIDLPFWVLGTLAVLLARPRDAQAQAALVVAMAGLVCYFFQGKGFPYHALPATVGLAWALWLILAERGAPLAEALRRPLAALALALAFALAALIGPFRAPQLGPLEAAVDRLPPHTVFVVIAAHSWLAFPLVEDHDFVWPLSGGIALMPIKTILREGEGPKATPRGLYVRRWTLDRLASDLARCPAQAILVDDPADSQVLAGTGADYLHLLREDPRFVALLAHYRVVARDGRRELLLARPGALPPATRCFAAA